jgi:hypothetical protein
MTIDRTRRARRIGALLLLSMASVLAATTTAGAQATEAVRGGPMVTATPGQATSADVRRELMLLLKNYPPAIGQVLALDPTLLNNDAYMAGYPGLVAFLQKYPEVRRNASYYLAYIQPNSSGYDPAVAMWNDLVEAFMVFGVIVSIAVALGWIIRTIVDYRRWNRLAKVQSEAHTKILDRFTANDELLAYVQSAAGSRYLQSAPIALDPGARQPGAPFGRILWSVQAGLVIAAGGLGFFWVSSRPGIDVNVMHPLYTLGVVGIAIGLGFVLSAFVAFGLSKRLGLFETTAAAVNDRFDRRDAPGV